MANIRTRPSSAVLLSIVLLATSCATGPPPGPVEIAGLEAKKIVIAPLNMALALAPRLASSTRIVEDALTHNIEAHEKTVEELGYRVARSLWVESAKKVRLSGVEQSFESAAKVFARQVADKIDFDAMIIASLYLQNAKVGERTVRWDSANQPITFIGQSRWEIEMPSLSTIPAASIHVYILDRMGNKIHSKRTGVELIQHLEIRVGQRKGHDRQTWTLVDDDPAIEDPVRVRAAIAHALSPFLRY